MNFFKKEQELSMADKIFRKTKLKTKITTEQVAFGVNLSECGFDSFIHNNESININSFSSMATNVGMKMNIGGSNWFIFSYRMRELLPKEVLEKAREIGVIITVRNMKASRERELISNGSMQKFSAGEQLGYFVLRNQLHYVKESIKNINYAVG